MACAGVQPLMTGDWSRTPIRSVIGRYPTGGSGQPDQDHDQAGQNDDDPEHADDAFPVVTVTPSFFLDAMTISRMTSAIPIPKVIAPHLTTVRPPDSTFGARRRHSADSGRYLTCECLAPGSGWRGAAPKAHRCTEGRLVPTRSTMAPSR